jgi:predicted ribosomally synthesized peptide with SipW-like signal peptide
MNRRTQIKTKESAIFASLKRVVAALLILSINWSGLAAVGTSMAAFTDREGSSGNIFTAGTLDLKKPVSADFSPTVTPANATSTKDILVENNGNLPFKYQIKIDDVSGALCSNLTLKAIFNGEKYSGPITEDQNLISDALPVLAKDGKDSWNFKAILKSSDPDLKNTNCTFKFTLNANQTDGVGFSDEEFISNTVTSSSWDASVWTQTTVPQFSEGATTSTAIVGDGDGAIKLADAAVEVLGNDAIGSAGYPSTGYSVGNTAAGSEFNDNGYLIWEPYVTSVPLTVNKIYTYGTVSGNVKAAIYSDNAGNPGAKLTAEASDPAVANTWNAISVSDTYLPAGKYWIVFEVNTENAITASDPANGSRKGKLWNFGTEFPNNPASSGSILNIGDRSDCIYFTGTLAQRGVVKATKAVLSDDDANISSAKFYSHAAGSGRLAIYDNIGSDVLPLSGWNYRKNHTIQGSSGAGSGYQIRIVAHKGMGTDTGADVYLGNNVRDDFGDVRFTDDDGAALLNYWMEPGSFASGSQAAFWVKVNDDLGSTQSIYVYYGNGNATYNGIGANTFVMFDDFDSQAINTSKWKNRYGDAPSFSGGLMTFEANDHDPSKLIAIGAPTDNNLAIGARFQITGGSDSDERIGLGVKTSNTKDTNFWGTHTSSSYDRGFNYVLHNFSSLNEVKFLDDGEAWGNANYGSWSKNRFYTMEVFYDGTNVRGRTDYGVWNAWSRSGRSGYLALNIGSKDATSVWDWAYVRKAIASEPSQGAWGAEESNSRPNNRLWESGDVPMVAGWNTVSVAGLTLNAGTYWLAWQWDSASAGPSYAAGSAGDGYYFGQSYGAFPEALSGGTSSSEEWSMYLNYSKYAASGTFESNYFDNGKINYWDAVEWDEVAEEGITDINFEIGTANANPNSAESWSWTAVSGNSPIILALPETRYIKWRANLTGNGDKTPILNEVRIKYYEGAASQHIVLNEFLPNPEDTEYGFDFGQDGGLMPQGEWVEIYNKIGGKPVDLGAWKIQNAAGESVEVAAANTKGGSTIINPGDWAVVYMNRALLGNMDDTVKLLDMFDNVVDSHTYDIGNDCDLQPTLDGANDATPSAANCLEVPGNKSYARIPDGYGPWIDPIPTPGTPNELSEEEVAAAATTTEEVVMKETAADEFVVGDQIEIAAENGTTTEEVAVDDVIINTGEGTEDMAENGTTTGEEAAEENGTTTYAEGVEAAPVEEPQAEEPQISLDEVVAESGLPEAAAPVEELPVNDPVPAEVPVTVETPAVVPVPDNSPAPAADVPPVAGGDVPPAE